MCIMACINYINTNFVLCTSYGFDKNTTCTETARTSEFTGNPYLYRTRINVNGRH